MNQLDKTIVALDQMTDLEIDAFLNKANHQIKFVKIGLELYLKYGSSFVKKINENYKLKIFLDLKLHDIPTTVQMAIRSLKDLPIEFLTVHLGGGEEMLHFAMEEVKKSLPETKILGVSFLTCLSNADLLSIYGINDSIAGFTRLFSLADKTKIDGVICSPLELTLVKQHFPKLMAVTPGIRFLDESNLTDQKRIATPTDAFKNNADYIVMGRSLTKAVDLNHRLKELSIPISIF